MTLSEYIQHDGVSLAELISKGEVTAAELEQCAHEAIEKINPSINAIIEVFDEPDADLSAAGPFRGVPFLMKDIGMHAQGRLYEMGSRLAAGMIMPHDTHLMERFRGAGLVTLGRTATPEFGWNITTESVLTGPTHNPWDLARMPGGSSGGSAAAVAAGIVPMAHANDGAGSIRVPAACCGLVGLKPTRGRTPPGPDTGELVFGHGVEFAVTRSVRDSAVLLDAVQGAGPGDPYVIAPPARPYREEITISPGRLRIAFSAEPLLDVPVDEEVRTGLEAIAHLCDDLGHDVQEAAPTADGEAWLEAAPCILVSAGIAHWIEEIMSMTGRKPGPDTLESTVLAIYEHGRHLRAADLMKGFALANTICRTVAPFFDQYDVLLSPTNALVPQLLGTYNANDPKYDVESWARHIISFCPFTPLFNMTGQPSISLPLWRTDKGLPVGMQLTARFGDEATLFQLARQLEEAKPWPLIAPLIDQALISAA